MTLGEQTRFEQLRTQLLRWRAGATIRRSVTAMSNRFSDDDKRQELLTALKDHLSGETGADSSSLVQHQRTILANLVTDLQVPWQQVHALSSQFAQQLKASAEQVGARLASVGVCFRTRVPAPADYVA